MARRDDFDDFFGDDDETPVVDTRADGRLYRVPLGRLSANLVNPRTDFGTEDQQIDLGKSLARRQNQPCPVVSRGAYLKLWPDHADRIGDVDYVLVSGERRYRAANKVGLHALDCVANDDFAADRRTFMEAVVSENVDRQNFDPIEEAYAVQALVTEFGSNRAVAQHFERVDGWVTQRVLLTHLAREVQDLVRQKTMPLEAARQLGKLARDNEWSVRDQLEWWDSEQDRRAAVAAARSAARKASRQAPAERPMAVPQPAESTAMAQPGFTAVKPAPTAPAPEPRPAVVERQRELVATAAAGRQTEPSPPPAPAVEQSVPEPRAAVQEAPEADVVTGRRFPYGNGPEAARFILERMPPEEFARMFPILFDHYISGPEAARFLIERMPAEEFDLMFQVLADHYRSRHGSLD